MSGATLSAAIDAQAADLAGWRNETLARVRAPVRAAVALNLSRPG